MRETFVLVAAALDVVVGAVLFVLARRLRRRLEVHSTVLLDGVPHRVAVVRFEWEGGPPEYGFENLGEALARMVVLEKQSMSLGELLVRSGWQPPTVGGTNA